VAIQSTWALAADVHQDSKRIKNASVDKIETSHTHDDVSCTFGFRAYSKPLYIFDNFLENDIIPMKIFQTNPKSYPKQIKY
jgi:hypothetical protein